MNSILKLLITASILLTSVEVFAIEPDKEKHIQYSAMLSSAIYLNAHYRDEIPKKWAFLVAVTFTMAIGAAKELTDEKIDYADLRADLLGAVIAPLILIQF